MKKIICNSALTVLLVFTSSQSFGSPSAKGQTDCSIQPTVLTYMTPATDEEKATTEAALPTFKMLCSKTGGMSYESSGDSSSDSFDDMFWLH